MISSVKKLSGSQAEVKVQLTSKELKDYEAEAEKELAAAVHIEGYRPGKAPKEIIRKRVGEETIRQEAIELAVRKSLDITVKKEKLNIIDQGELKIEKNDEQGLSYSIILNILPEVKLGKYTGLAVAKKPVTISDADLETVMKELVRSRTKAEEVNRPAQAGDRVEVDYKIFLAGKLIDGGQSENHPLIIGEGRFIPGFEEQLIGLSANEKKDVSLKAPDDFYQKEIAGRELKIEVILKKVEKLTPPEVNDDFAKGLGNFGSLSELRQNLLESLKKEKEAEEKERVRLALLNQITSASDCEAPKALVDDRLDSMIKEFDGELHQKGMELGFYLAKIGKTQDDLRRDWQSKAEDQTKMSLVIRAIAAKESISASEEEIAREFAAVADSYIRRGMMNEIQNSDAQALQSKIKEVLTNEKVFDFLEKNNVLT